MTIPDPDIVTGLTLAMLTLAHEDTANSYANEPHNPENTKIVYRWATFWAAQGLLKAEADGATITNHTHTTAHHITQNPPEPWTPPT